MSFSWRGQWIQSSNCLHIFEGEPQDLSTFPSNWVMSLGYFCGFQSLSSSYLTADLGSQISLASLPTSKKQKLFHLHGSLQNCNLVNDFIMDYHWKKVIHKLKKVESYYFSHWICSELQGIIQSFQRLCPRTWHSLTAHEFLKLGGKVFNSERRQIKGRIWLVWK